MAINIFVSNTPFQFFVVEQLISSFFKNDKNIIYLTFETKHKIYGVDIRYIRKSIFSILDIRKFRKDVNNVNAFSDEVTYFVPHINNLFGNYLLSRSIEFNIPIRVYYEGIAIFYDPVVKLSNRTIFLRKILAFLGGISYCHSDVLFPTELRARAIAYTPLKEFTSCFKEIIEFNFNVIDLGKDCNEKVLILAPPIYDKNSLKLFLNSSINFITKKRIKDVYIKFHYETNKIYINNLVEYFNTNLVKVELLPNNVPIEILMNNMNFDIIYSSYFSSALINIRLMFGSKVDIYMHRKVYKEFIEKLIFYTNIKQI